MGSLTLAPGFDPGITEYTAETTNATNNITAVPADVNATVEILRGGVPVENGTAANWDEGENVVTITVANGAAQTIYTVVVTKS